MYILLHRLMDEIYTETEHPVQSSNVLKLIVIIPSSLASSKLSPQQLSSKKGIHLLHRVKLCKLPTRGRQSCTSQFQPVDTARSDQFLIYSV